MNLDPRDVLLHSKRKLESPKSAKNVSTSCNNQINQILLENSLKKINSQRQLSEKVTAFVFKGYHPFSIVEEGSFIELLEGCLSAAGKCKLTVPSRKMVVKQLEKDFSNYELKLEEILNKMNFVEITADVWKAHHRYCWEISSSFFIMFLPGIH